jgi:integrase
MKIPGDDDVSNMIDSITGKRMEVAILLGACVGLRRSEISALKPEDFNLEKGTIAIKRAFVRDKKTKQWVLKGTKTYNSTRTLNAPRFIIEKALALEPVSGYVIGLMPNTITNQFCCLRNKLGIDCRFHDLRHYNASIMLALGIPDKYAMERMGHATTNMLKTTYQHTFAEKTIEVSQLINAQIEEKFGKNDKPPQ